jgi:sRNA-binding regulator protein Hfq
MDAATKTEMQRLMETECLRKPVAKRVATGEITLDQVKMSHPGEYAISYRAKNLLAENADMTRARAFWLAEDPRRIEEMRRKQIRTFATKTGLSEEMAKDIATGKTNLAALAKQDPRWAFIWSRAKTRIKAFKVAEIPLDPMDAIRWARADYGLPFGDDEDQTAIQAKTEEVHATYPFLKKRHARRMARFDLTLAGLADVSPANCGWAVRANELWQAYPGHHRKFIRLMAMMGLDDTDAASFIEKTESAREMHRNLASSGRKYYFRLYQGERDSELTPDDNPFAWVLKGEEKNSKLPKLQALFFCPSEARGAVFGLATKDHEVAELKLGPAMKPSERMEVETIQEHLDRSKERQKSLSVTLRNGLVFTGDVSWHSPFELQLKLKNDSWLIILYHAVHTMDLA